MPLSTWVHRARGVARQSLRALAIVLFICAALAGLGLIFNPPRPGPPRPQGAITRVYKKGS